MSFSEPKPNQFMLRRVFKDPLLDRIVFETCEDILSEFSKNMSYPYKPLLATTQNSCFESHFVLNVLKI